MNNGLSGGWILVFITTGNRGEAEKIAGRILEEKLAACVNIVDDIESLYWWKGRIEKGVESLMIIKSRIEKLPELIRLVKKEHSYEVPEIIAVPILAGSPDYLKWLDESTMNT